MAILIRIFLIGLIIYLLVRSFAKYSAGQEPEEREAGDDLSKESGKKGVSKEIGEYIDYEEVKDDD